MCLYPKKHFAKKYIFVVLNFFCLSYIIISISGLGIYFVYTNYYFLFQTM